MEFRDLSENQQPSDIILSSIKGILEYGDDKTPRIDTVVNDLTLGQIDRYMEKIKIDQDLPFKLTRIRGKEIEDERVYNAVCEHCSISDVPFNSLLNTKVYFIETSDSAVVFIPIQLEKGVINMCVELLDKENTIPEIYSMYMKLSKMRMSDIKFVKLTSKK